ncbi:hypothetical protein GCM10010390_41240 [Streptomyces mordarskii]|uniref:Uncharacterized protein n=1 Tax=Streptomyces mordarskii TaxID=1226758 RepID=A0ABP3N7P6_9ACTN
MGGVLDAYVYVWRPSPTNSTPPANGAVKIRSGAPPRRPRTRHPSPATRHEQQAHPSNHYAPAHSGTHTHHTPHHAFKGAPAPGQPRGAPQ